jgi:hypothetical protein
MARNQTWLAQGSSNPATTPLIQKAQVNHLAKNLWHLLTDNYLHLSCEARSNHVLQLNLMPVNTPRETSINRNHQYHLARLNLSWISLHVE